jgi:hypothetical protein
MAESVSADTERQLDEVAGELHGLLPDEFTAARDERVKTARAAGDGALAREIAKLRKPTQSTWLINLLWRDQREVLEQFFGSPKRYGRRRSRPPALNCGT